MIAMVDYGAGNLRSVAKAFEKLGHAPEVTGDPKKVLSARAVVLPGVGASDSAMSALETRGLVEPLRILIRKGIPFFGVCLGLQLLLESSEEGDKPCLGVVPGGVKKFPDTVKTPHMGWNEVTFQKEHPVFEGVESGSYFYFVHSYYAAPEDNSLVLGMTDYALPFCSVVASDNMVATQFHPEKSGATGLRLYENFMRSMVKDGVRG